jgi:adenylate cyclase
VTHADHAKRALEAALASNTWLAEFNARCVAEGKPALKTGFGLASGQAFVGNVGSPTRLNYTALGDTVNLASRLEGASKTYGVGVLCDASVRDAVGPGYVWRCLDVVAVKGKERPARVYEPLGREGEVPAERLAFARAYEAALEDYVAQRFDVAEARLLTLAPAQREDVGVVRLLALCRAYRAAPPPADWDGVARLTTK